MQRIVECVPNFSEGRKAEVVERLAEAIESVEGALVLDQHRDPDHNRSVITFIATPESVVEAAVRVVALAAELIDLRGHAGQHPRIGATDVLPFVPVRGVAMEECVRLAHTAGKRIAGELGIPVYFYERAARHAERVNLEDVRRGGFEGLVQEIGIVAERAPDVGEARVHESAGAIAIGARYLLIAYNINLHTTDLAVARRIARAVRGRDGGLRYLKALGLELRERGLVQVSMNLVRYDKTHLHHAFEAVRREAERWGVQIAGTEIVGLIPQAALERSAEYFLQMENFTPNAVLENRIATVLAAQATKKGAEGDLGNGERVKGHGVEAVAVPFFPFPPSSGLGGGAAAAQAGALGAAVGEMVAQLIEGQRKFAGLVEDVRDALQELALLRARLMDAAGRDAASFERVLVARRLPASTEDEQRTRHNEIEAALKGATVVPLEVMAVAVQIAELIEILAEMGDAKWLSDAATGAQLALASVVGARYNVLVNTAEIADEEFVFENRSRADSLLEHAREVSERVEAMLMDSLFDGDT